MMDFTLKIPVKLQECYECFGPTEVSYRLETEISPPHKKRRSFTYYKPFLHCTNPKCGTVFAASEYRKYLEECLDVAEIEFIPTKHGN